MKKAVILLSGGLDSTTCLAIAQKEGYECYCISFAYGQKQQAELKQALQISQRYGAKRHEVVNLDIGKFGGSALTDPNITVPEYNPDAGIPLTYVPARNTIFLSIALGWAEVLEADAIFIGANHVDYSGYPDCRPEYIAAFQRMADLATKQGVEGRGVQIITPLMELDKAAIVELGIKLGVDYSQTITCYDADAEGAACGKCDSCILRKNAFFKLGIADPTKYQAKK